MKKMKFDWKIAEKELPPNDEMDRFQVLMCKIYVHSAVDPEVEYYYEVGHFSEGKFYGKDGKEYKPDYWAIFNEPSLRVIRQQVEINKPATLEDAIAIATEAHKGQTDKAGATYILHPLRLMMKMKTETEMITAILHDVVEDCDWTIEKIREQGFSEEVLEALECVTNREGESYEDFIERAGQNPIARQVKIADLEDNMDIKRLAILTDKDTTRISKYLRAWTSLARKTNDSDKNNSVINVNMPQEQDTRSTENQFRKLTPEQTQMVEDRHKELSEAVIQGLHQDNQEIFGEDYIENN